MSTADTADTSTIDLKDLLREAEENAPESGEQDAETTTLAAALAGARPFALPTLDTAVYEPDPVVVRPSIFAAKKSTLYASYAVEFQFRDRVMGGTPKDPHIIKSWLRSKTGVTPEAELQNMTADTLRDLGVEVPDDATWEQIVKASEQIADNKSVGFKRDKQGGLYLESRVVKAMIKEVVSILFSDERWGATRKGPKSYAAERVFVNPDRIYLGRHQPDGTQLFVGHTTGPKGPQSNLTLYEFVYQPAIQFTLIVLRNSIRPEWWEESLMHGEENGLAALRSQGYGRYNVTRFERLPDHLRRDEAQTVKSSRSPAAQQAGAGDRLIPEGDEPTPQEAARIAAGAPAPTLDQKLRELEQS